MRGSWGERVPDAFEDGEGPVPEKAEAQGTAGDRALLGGGLSWGASRDSGAEALGEQPARCNVSKTSVSTAQHVKKLTRWVGAQVTLKEGNSL